VLRISAVRPAQRCSFLGADPAFDDFISLTSKENPEKRKISLDKRESLWYNQ
jgi:hypothetical protein